jgi:hypothetical protein
MTPAKYLLLIGLLLSAAFIFSACGEDTPTEEQGPETLTIVSNQATMFHDSGESFVFTVTGDDGMDYTASSEFYANNALLFNNTFQSNTEGIYTIYAKYKNRQSNSINVEVIDRSIQLASLTVSANMNRIVEDSGDAFVFSAIGTRRDGTNVDLSDLEGIKYYVNNTLISGKTFTPTEINEYTVHATFNDDLSSNSIIVKCISDPAIYAHKVLIEDFTGIWCGWCTRVLYSIEQVHAQTDKVVVAAIHRGNLDPNQEGHDPWNLPQGYTLEGHWQIMGYPTAYLNRIDRWTNPQTSHINEPIDMLKPSSAYGIGISSTMGASSGSITATIHFNDDLEKAKCVVYVLEDNLIYKQDNYVTDLYGGQDPIPNFNHKDVVRTVATNILGDAIPANQSVAENTYTAQFSASYISADVNNLKVMFILLDSNGYVANVQVAPANTTQEYEMK